MLISLGDTHRYLSQTTSSTDYGEARKWYLTARTIAPSNGRTYNQLAVVAINAKRNFEAIYYYMRSLSSTHTPIASARERLIVLFSSYVQKVGWKKSPEKSPKKIPQFFHR